ncbi:MAG: sigma-70 family RNA polymerase sigma factor [Aureliella sp.]
MQNIPETRQSLLLQLANSSNQRAWEEFVELYQPAVYRVAVSNGLQDADAQDLVQTVFVSVAGAIGQWSEKDTGQRFRYWLLRIAKNATVNAITRKPIAQRIAGLGHEEVLQQVADANQETQSIVELEYRREVYIRAAEQVQRDVNPDTWRAFELTAIEGLSKEAAANELGKSVGTVYAARSRIMKRLCEAVAELEGEYA